MELAIARGHLIATSSRPIGVAERQALRDGEALLVAHLVGAPLNCVLCDEPAVTVAWPSAPVCEQHVGR